MHSRPAALSIAESLLHGKPCVCGGNGALGEVARRGGCLFVDQTNEDSLATGIRKLLTDQEIFLRLCAEARSRKFRSWPDYMDRLVEHLQSRRERTARAVECAVLSALGSRQQREVR
jgi:glycosyltransferase involved in cell wall biosynthesis